MGDIGERPAMDQCRGMFQGLHQVGLQRVFQQNRHGPGSAEVRCGHRPLVPRFGHDDPAQTSLKLRQVTGEAEDRHGLARDGDIERGFSHRTVIKPQHNPAQRPLVEIERATPDDLARIDVERITPVEMIVDHRRQQIGRSRDRMEIPGKMQIDLIHRCHLRATTAGCPALGTEARAKARLA